MKRKVGRPKDEQLRIRRREEILAAAIDIFAGRGYPQTDLQMVADKIKVSKGTLYRYFPSKKALFFAAVDWGIRQLDRQVQSAIDRMEDPLERIANAIYAYLSFFRDHPEVAELLIQERAQFKNRKHLTYFEYRKKEAQSWKTLTNELIEQGRLRNIPMDQIMDVSSNLLYGTMFTNFFTGPEKSCEEQVREILNILFWGVLSDKGRKTTQLPEINFTFKKTD